MTCPRSCDDDDVVVDDDDVVVVDDVVTGEEINDNGDATK